MNGLKTFGLMAILTLILGAIGYTLGGTSGIVIALIIAAIGNFISYWYSDKMVLRAYRAQPLENNHPIYQLTEKLARNAELPIPKVYIINQSQPNAFATGRNPEHAVVAVTQGLLDLMNENEVAGVIGHELGHIKHRDILTGTIAATLAGAISSVGYATRFGMGRRNGGGNALFFIIAMVVAPLAASLIRMAISRTREFKADEFGAKVSGNPRFLSNALNKLESYSKRIPMRGNPSTSHMFIVHPFKGKALANLFSTHPPTQKRIEKLEQMR